MKRKIDLDRFIAGIFDKNSVKHFVLLFCVTLLLSLIISYRET